MANSPQARKRARQNDKARAHNASLRSLVRTVIKKVNTAVSSGDVEAAKAAYNDAVPVIDTMVNKGIVNKNKAARHKSRLNKRVKALTGLRIVVGRLESHGRSHGPASTFIRKAQSIRAISSISACKPSLANCLCRATRHLITPG